VKSEQSGARSLSDAIDTYRAEYQKKLDKQALNLLSRLAKSTDASEAFRRLGPKSRRAEADLLAACIEANDVVRNFPRLVQKQKDALSRSTQWHKSLAELRSFAAEISEEKEPLRRGLANLDLWSLSIFEPPTDNNVAKQALDLIARAIEWRRGIAQQNLANLGVTRKARTKKAAENAAIGILAAGVYDAMRVPPLPVKRQGKHAADPNLTEIADFAQVILGVEISTDRVREIRRKHRKEILKMHGAQTKRYLADKALQARSRDPS
jgi:hypothetical protein